MKNSLIILCVFIAGGLTGLNRLIPEDWFKGNTSIIILYILIFQVGISIGSNKDLKDMIRFLSPRMLILPLSTIAGTLLFSFLASFAISQWRTADCICLLFTVFSADYRNKTGFGRHTDSNRTGNAGPAGKHHPRNDFAHRSTPVHPNVRKTRSHLGSRNQLDGCNAADGKPLFRKEHGSACHPARNYPGNKRAAADFLLLQHVTSLLTTYSSSRNLKVPATGSNCHPIHASLHRRNGRE